MAQLKQPIGANARAILDLAQRPKEQAALTARKDKLTVTLGDGKLAPRLRHLLERRMTGAGRVVSDFYHRALAEKYSLHKGSPGLNNAPAGPGHTWLSVGPRNINGRIKCLAIHPTNGDVLYAGSAAGGVWRSNDGGQSWLPTMHDEASLAIGSIALDPSNPDVVYAATGEAVYLLSSGVPLPPGDEGLAWYYAGVGVYRSGDGGGSWALLGAMENRFNYRIAVDPFNAQHLLCAGYSLVAGQGGLARSTDGGATWTTVRQGIFTDVVFDAAHSGRVYAASYNGGVWKSTDSGATWNQRNGGLPATSSMGRVSLTLAAANTDVLYAKIEADATGDLLGVYRTSVAAEGATAWTATTAPGVDAGYAWWCSWIAADPTDTAGDVVWAGGVDIARSDDGGATWTKVADAYGGTTPPTHADQHALVFHPTSANTVFAANDGGVFRGTWTGLTPPVTWTKASGGLVVTQFYDLAHSAASPSLFGGGAQDNGSMVSTGGLSWRHVNGGDGGYMLFHPTDPYTFWAQWQNAAIRRTSDGGATWTWASSGIGGGGVFPATVMTLDPANPSILFAGTGAVYRTTSGGTSGWSAASGNVGGVTDIAIAPSDSAYVYAGGLDGRLHRATDGGVTATSFSVVPTPGLPGRWLAGIAVHPTNRDQVYLCYLGFNGTSADQVWRGTYDSATTTWTWTLRVTGLPDVPCGAILVHPTSLHLFLATDVGVFRSTDDGASWTPFEQGLPNVPVVDLTLDPSRDLLRCATHGRGAWQVSLAAPAARVDLYLRDNLLDTGEILPCPRNIPDPTTPGAVVRHWHSADIKVDASPFAATDAVVDGVEFDDPEHPYVGFGNRIEDIDGLPHERPYRGRTNRVYVQVHNRGWDTAASVTVKLLWADAGAALPALPGDFWSSFPADTFDQTNWKVIGTVTETQVRPATPRVVRFDWNLPAGVSDHCCLLAIVDSPDDPVLPASEVVVDLLTPMNKRVTHRNVSPMDPPVAPTGLAPMAWTAVSLWNPYPEDRVFGVGLGGVVGPLAGLCLVVDRKHLPQGVKTTGFRVIDPNLSLVARMLHAAPPGHLSASVVRGIGAMSAPQELFPNGASLSPTLHGVHIPAGERIVAYVGASVPEGVDLTRYRADVLQLEGGTVLGGNTLVFDVAGARAKAPRKVRVILDRIRILDDRDPWIKLRGEFALTSRVRVGNAPPAIVRLPEEGTVRLGRPGGPLELAPSVLIFEGWVQPADPLAVEIRAVEHDLLSREELQRYRRTFHGDPRGYAGVYAPGDERNDPESLQEWRVWLRIEVVA